MLCWRQKRDPSPWVNRHTSVQKRQTKITAYTKYIYLKKKRYNISDKKYGSWRRLNNLKWDFLSFCCPMGLSLCLKMYNSKVAHGAFWSNKKIQLHANIAKHGLNNNQLLLVLPATGNGGILVVGLYSNMLHTITSLGASLFCASVVGNVRKGLPSKAEYRYYVLSSLHPASLDS